MHAGKEQKRADQTRKIAAGGSQGSMPYLETSVVPPSRQAVRVLRALSPSLEFIVGILRFNES
jgi:hypothetical protein